MANFEVLSQILPSIGQNFLHSHLQRSLYISLSVSFCRDKNIAFCEGVRFARYLVLKKSKENEMKVALKKRS